MAAAKLNASKTTAAHARAKADEVSFNAREGSSEQKKRQEFQNQNEMYNERERNRLRKLHTQENRKWDAKKRRGSGEGLDDQDHDFLLYGSRYRRGMHKNLKEHILTL